MTLILYFREMRGTVFLVRLLFGVECFFLYMFFFFFLFKNFFIIRSWTSNIKATSVWYVRLYCVRP